jgi:hypothetical protein
MTLLKTFKVRNPCFSFVPQILNEQQSIELADVTNKTSTPSDGKIKKDAFLLTHVSPVVHVSRLYL